MTTQPTPGIDSHIPIPPPPPPPPPPSRTRTGKFSARFRAMQVGDSFFVPGATCGRMLQASRRYRANGERYTARKEADGARIWRIA